MTEFEDSVGSEIDAALVSFEEWAEENDSRDWRRYLEECQLLDDLQEALRKHFLREEQLGFPTNVTISVDSASDNTERGSNIGPYHLLEKIGEGGMGVVWLAEQKEPIKRRVAIKLIRSDHDHDDVVARFEQERQTLAIMDHENIAKVLDAGSTEDGRPYFVMEYVKGIPFTEYCDRQRLNPRERLELFIPVCLAVQHAHQKAIIHRDIKPSNVLVTVANDKPVPKVIDFGLAKALEPAQRLTDKTFHTGIGRVMGTIQYMSPEQAATDSMDIDTRTDVYSLGVMLYKLLTGSTPLEQDTVERQAVLRMLELVRDQEAERPSDRLTRSHDKLSAISQQRRVAPKELRQILRNDLDWIVLKALEKDRVRRYSTAAAFAEDIKNFLDGQPVKARPPSVGYIAWKFVKRHRGAVMSVAAVAAVLVVAFIGVTMAWRQTKEAWKETSIYSQKLEEAEGLAAEAVMNLTEDLDEQLTGSVVIDTPQLAELQESPMLRSKAASARMLTRIGRYVRHLGVSPSESQKWFDAAITEFEELEAENGFQGGPPITYTTALNNAGQIAHELGDAEKAIRVHNKEIELLKDHVDPAKEPHSSVSLALAYFNLANRKDAYENLSKAIELLEPIRDSSRLARYTLGTSYYNRAYEGGSNAAKKKDLKDAISIFSSTGFNDDLAIALDLLSVVQDAEGDFDAAMATSKKAMAIVDELLAKSPRSRVAHERAAKVYYNAGHRLLAGKGDATNSFPFYERAVKSLDRLRVTTPNYLKENVMLFGYWELAESAMYLREFERAGESYDVALEILQHHPSRSRMKTFFRIRRIRCQCESDLDGGLQALEELGDLDSLTFETSADKADVYFTVVGIYSLASGEKSDEDQKTDYLEKSIAVLEQMREKNLLNKPYLMQMSMDPDYRSVRQDPRFDELTSLKD